MHIVHQELIYNGKYWDFFFDINKHIRTHYEYGCECGYEFQWCQCTEIKFKVISL